MKTGPRHSPEWLRWFEQQRRAGPESEDDPPPVKVGDLRAYVFLESGPEEGTVLRVQWTRETPDRCAHWTAIIEFVNRFGSTWAMGVDAWRLEPAGRC